MQQQLEMHCFRALASTKEPHVIDPVSSAAYTTIYRICLQRASHSMSIAINHNIASPCQRAGIIVPELPVSIAALVVLRST